MNRSVIFLTVLFIALSGCGGGAAESGSTEFVYGPSESSGPGLSSAPVNKSGTGEVTATVGRAGGTLELSNGVRVEIPPGTIEDRVDVVLKIAPLTTVFKNEEFERAVGPLFLFTPDITAPEGKSIIVSMPFSAFPEGYTEKNLYLATEEVGNQQRAFGENSTATKWEYQKVKMRDGKAVAEVDSLSGMRLQFVLSR